jgi:excisionase family DNA binding protein
MSDEWITTAQAAQITGYNAEHIRRLVRLGKVSSKKWGKEWMIDKASLLAYVESEGRGPKAKKVS